MIIQQGSNLQNKWNKTFWIRGYYVTVTGNVTEKYITEQSEETRKEDSEEAVFSL